MTPRRTRFGAHLTAIALVASSATFVTAQRTGDGTAEISGIVVTTTVPPTPLARVLVTISGASLKPSRTAITNDQGRFAFTRLPAGTFTIVAARRPYVRSTFGAKRPGRPGTPIDLAAGQRVTGITIPLAHGSTITGVIRDVDGEPAAQVKVDATPRDSQPGPTTATVVTDDRGTYRIFGLPPGAYTVLAGVTDRGRSELTQFSDAEMDQLIARLQSRSAAAGTASAGTGRASQGPSASARSATYGYAPMHYPGTPDPDQAVAVVLGEDEERAGIDIGLRFVRTAAVEGRVSGPTGALPANTQVTLTRRLAAPAGPNTLIAANASRPPDASGGFRFTGILPGKYRLLARSVPPDIWWAVADITIDGDDVGGLALNMQPGLRMSGRVMFESKSQAPPTDPSSLRLRLVDVESPSTFVPFGNPRTDGTFEISGIVPGTYGMTTAFGLDGWSLSSVMAAGRDLLDVPLEISATRDVTGVVATFSDRIAELSGTLQSAVNVPAPDYFVVVFPSDRTLWRPGARRIQFARPTTDGRFQIRDLPPGDYLVAALTDMEASDVRDASFLERLVPASLAFHLNTGEKRTQNLTIAR